MQYFLYYVCNHIISFFDFYLFPAAVMFIFKLSLQI